MKVTVMLTQRLRAGDFVTGGENLKCVAFFALYVSCKSRDFGSNLKYIPSASHKYTSPIALNLVFVYGPPDCKKHINSITCSDYKITILCTMVIMMN